MWKKVERNFDEFGKVPVHDDVCHPGGHSLRQQGPLRFSARIPAQQSVKRPATHLTESRK